ncbi:MAG: DUF1579 family protein [Planctomycetota bacterium]
MFRLVGVAFVVVSGLGLVTQDPVPEPRLLQKAQQLSVPGDQHALLGTLAGDWDVVVRTHAPGKAATEDRGSLRCSPILGGRWCVLNFTLTLQGASVEAVQILGFDTLRKLWTSSWRDELATWAVDATGPVSAERPRVLALAGTLVDARDPTGRPFRLQLDLRDAQRVTARLSDTVGEQLVEVQTQEWTRK